MSEIFDKLQLTLLATKHTSSMERFSDIIDQKAVTHLIFFIGTLLGGLGGHRVKVLILKV